MGSDWREDLERWLAPFLAALGHKTRSRMCPAYVAGLIGIGERKSVQPMAMRDGSVSYDQLHHFIAAGRWDVAPLEEELVRQADQRLGGEDAFLIVDDTALPKKGTYSVGVAPQYASALGKNANCQTLVSLTLARAEVPAMVGLRLFLPETWTSDATRLARAGVPEDQRAYKTKPEIALEEIDRLRAAGLRFGCVLADAGYGLSAPFRQALSERGLAWAVGIPRTQKVYPSDVTMIFPAARRPPRSAPPRAGCRLGPRPGHAGERPLAQCELAARHEGQACSPLRRRPRARRRRRAAKDRRHGRAAPPRRGGLARRRASLIGREEVLSLQPARRRATQALGRRDQGAMGLRAGASADEGGAWPRPLRGAILARAQSACAHDHDRLPLPSVPPPR